MNDLNNEFQQAPNRVLAKLASEFGGAESRLPVFLCNPTNGKLALTAGRQQPENTQAARPPRRQAPSPTRSPARAGLIAGATTGGVTALVAGVFVCLLVLTTVFPPVGLGLLALIGIGAGVSLVAGLIAGGIAARRQAKTNTNKSQTQTAEPITPVSMALASLGPHTAQAPVASLRASATAANTARAPAPAVTPDSVLDDENTASSTTASTPTVTTTPDLETDSEDDQDDQDDRLSTSSSRK